MNSRSCLLATLVTAAAPLLTAAGAQAQVYGAAGIQQPAPLYPYAARSDQPYAVEVAPNTYVIRRPAVSRAYPYVGCADNCAPRRVHHAARLVHRADAPRETRNDPALIEELRQRRSIKREVVNTRKIVRDPPVVVDTHRVVDDPPRVIERKHYADDAPAPPHPRKHAAVVEDSLVKAARSDPGKARVIRAEAEVTILGPDRMSIKLFRKGTAANAKASVE